MCLVVIRHLTGQHVEKVGRIIAVGQGSNRIFAIANTIPGCHDGSHHRCEAYGAALVGRGRIIVGIEIKRGEG